MSVSRREFLELAGTTALVASSVARHVALAVEDTASFGLPPAAQRPKFRWWWCGAWNSADQVEREVMAMADAGFGGFEIADVRDGLTVPMDPKQYGWGSARWKANVERALEVAARRGLVADITLGAHWPTGIPGVTPDHEAAAKELVHGSAMVAGGERYQGPVPASTTEPSGLRQHVVPPVITPVLVALQAWRQQGSAVEGTVTLEANSLVDLAGHVRDGHLDWIAPAGGTWHVLAFWMRGTAQIQNMFSRVRRTSMLAYPTPFVVDIYGKAATRAVTDYWDQHLLPPRTAALFRKVGGSFFEDSLELNAIKEWSPQLPVEFEERRGYALAPLLPLMAVAPGAAGNMPMMGPRGVAAPYAISGTDSARFDADLRKTVEEMYADNHVRALSEWAQAKGMGFRCQCAGLAASYATIPEGDNGDTIDSFSAKAAARDIGGHTILSDEAATFVGGSSGVADWRLMLFMIQRDFAGGVNQVVLHGFSSAGAPDATWPGFSAFGRAIGEDWGPRAPHWAMASDISGYISRLQRVLRAGRSQADLAVLGTGGRGGGGPSGAPPTNDSEGFGNRLRYAGYTRHFIDAALLAHPAATVSEGVLAPTAAGYRALLVNTVHEMDVATAQRLLSYAGNGLRIVWIGELPDDVPGLHAREERRAALRAALAALIAQPTVVRVANDAEAIARLPDLGIEPMLGFSHRSRVLPVVRVDGMTTYAYLLNDSDAPIELDVSLRGKGRLLRINAWDGRIEPLAARVAGDRVEARLAFRRNEAIVLALSSDPAFAASGLAGFRAMEEPLVGEARELTSWDLELEDWHPGRNSNETLKTRHVMRLDALRPWKDLPGMGGASGIGRYRTSVAIDKLGDPYSLELGRYGGTVRVYINDRRLPPIDQFTGLVDVGPYLTRGQNRIEVEVATNLNNRLAADHIASDFGGPPGAGPPPVAPAAATPPATPDPMNPPEARYLGAPDLGSAFGMAAGAGLPGQPRVLLDYGLLGPVRLVRYRSGP